MENRRYRTGKPLVTERKQKSEIWLSECGKGRQRMGSLRQSGVYALDMYPLSGVGIPGVFTQQWRRKIYE